MEVVAVTTTATNNIDTTTITTTVTITKTITILNTIFPCSFFTVKIKYSLMSYLFV